MHKLITILFIFLSFSLLASSEIILDKKKIYLRLEGERLKHRDFTMIRTYLSPKKIELVSKHPAVFFECLETDYHYVYMESRECGSYCVARNANGYCVDERNRSCDVQLEKCVKRRLKLGEQTNITKLDFTNAKQLQKNETYTYQVKINQVVSEYSNINNEELVVIDTPIGTSLIPTPKHYLYDSELEYQITPNNGEEVKLENGYYNIFKFIFINYR